MGLLGGHMKHFLCFLIATTLVQFVSASESTLSTQISVPKWKSSFNSYFYDFEGTRAQKNNAYEFGDTTLKMQMMSLQYQMDNGWALMGIASYFQNTVVTRLGGVDYKDASEGIADTILAASGPLMMSGSFMLLADAGVSLPTGSIDEQNPNAPGTRYPYNMQMGSGTTDGVLGLTPLYLTADYQLGSRLSTILRTGEKNDNGYRLGNQYKLDAWADFPLPKGFTPRVVGYYKYRDALKGQDSTFGRNFLVEYYHHSQINWDLSAALKYGLVISPKVALNAEAGVPLAQDSQNYDSVVISTQYYVNLGVTGQF